MGHENPEWKGNYAVRYWHEDWKAIIFSYIDIILSQGFRGLYLDKVDEFEYWSNPRNNESLVLSAKEAATKMINFIIESSDYCKNKVGDSFHVIPQNGERLLQYDNGSLLQAISGWSVEDLFYDGLNQRPRDSIDERTRFLDIVLSRAGKIVLSGDYVDDELGYQGENREQITDYIAKAEEKGYIPYVATIDRMLDEIDVIEGIQPPPWDDSHQKRTTVDTLPRKRDAQLVDLQAPSSATFPRLSRTIYTRYSQYQLMREIRLGELGCG